MGMCWRAPWRMRGSPPCKVTEGKARIIVCAVCLLGYSAFLESLGDVLEIIPLRDSIVLPGSFNTCGQQWKNLEGGDSGERPA